MPGLHRLNSPLVAVFLGVDGYEAITIPSGTVLKLTAKKFNGDRLLEVIWGDRMLLMFTEDLELMMFVSDLQDRSRAIEPQKEVLAGWRI